jgi:hypothetical protein
LLEINRYKVLRIRKLECGLRRAQGIKSGINLI